MKLWLVRRTDDVKYDEFDSFVIRANDEEEAKKMANTHSGWSNEVEVIEISIDGKSEVILGSFNAG